MKKNQTIVLLAVFSTLTFVGCSESSSKRITKKSSSVTSAAEAKSLLAEGKNAEAADLYSRVGEMLLAQEGGVILADTMFNKSLEANSLNAKANLYSAIIAPAMRLKGAVPRFEALVPDKNKVEKFKKEIEDTEINEYIEFALKLDPRALPAKNYEQARQFVRVELIPELKKSLEKISSIKEKEFTINPLSRNVGTNKIQACTYSTSWELVSCNSEKLKPKTYKVDQYDLKALSSTFATARNALAISSSFNLKSFEKISSAIREKKKSNQITDKVIVDLVKSDSTFLKIDGDKNDLREIFDSSETVLNQLLEFASAQDTLCSDKSAGHLADYICIDEESKNDIEEALAYVVGPKEIRIGSDEEGRDVKVELDLRALLNSKVESLQDLLPNKFDSKGRIVEFKDLTFAGIFPNGDFIEKAKTVVSE